MDIPPDNCCTISTNAKPAAKGTSTGNKNVFIAVPRATMAVDKIGMLVVRTPNTVAKAVLIAITPPNELIGSHFSAFLKDLI